jgi:hypothetical protein
MRAVAAAVLAWADDSAEPPSTVPGWRNVRSGPGSLGGLGGGGALAAGGDDRGIGLSVAHPQDADDDDLV